MPGAFPSVPADHTSVSDDPSKPASEMCVPYFRLTLSHEDIAAVTDVMRSGWIGQGPRTAQFEAEFARHEGGGHAVATNSCTAALHTALVALGVGPGDGVLVSTHAWVSAAEAIANCGGIPIFVDCHPEDQSMDLADAADKLARARRGDIPMADGPIPVRGVISVYFAGLIPDEAAISDFARAADLWFLADAAHALTAYWQDTSETWQPCGAGRADAYCYSFYPNKTITTGDGGMILTRDPELAERMRRVRNHGLSFDTWEGEDLPSWDRCVMSRGFKYTMTDMDAAFGSTQLARADDFAAARHAIASRYDGALAGRDDIAVMPRPTGRISADHLFPVRVVGRGGAQRNTVIATLKERGVDCRVHWRPLHKQPYYRDLGWRPEDCPQSTQSWAELITLPIFPGMTEAQVDYVIAQLCDVVAGLPGARDG